MSKRTIKAYMAVTAHGPVKDVQGWCYRYMTFVARSDAEAAGWRDAQSVEITYDDGRKPRKGRKAK